MPTFSDSSDTLQCNAISAYGYPDVPYIHNEQPVTAAPAPATTANTAPEPSTNSRPDITRANLVRSTYFSQCSTR